MEGLVVIEVVAMLVVVIPIAPLEIKHVGNDMGALVVLCCDGPTVTPDLEVVVELMGSFSC